ncbi:mucin-22-like isoform X2 [Acanthaster planci]|uniref:Mucin-22-like isoform X2 n=1 Tax=Acanthaster planci TaxID=133434 RepID=A0A8B7ZFI8_ACAPL|nr:mucin-22-like isoform X2 [Acanthaster planci]
MLPSDTARLVLMYLKDEGLTRTYRQFFNESPHLEELRYHPDIEPSIPYEKGLTEILNEYAKIINAIKDRLKCNQLVNSLWKMHSEVISQLKFQYTGNSGLLQTQEKRCVDQRVLSRYRLTGLRKQQELQRRMASQLTMTSPTSSPNSVASTSQPEISSTYSSVNSSYSLINSAHSVMNSGPTVVNNVSVATSPVDVENDSNHITRSGNAVREATRSISPGMEVVIQETGSIQQKKREIPDFQQSQVVIPEFRTPVKSSSSAGSELNTPTGKSPKRKSAAPRRIQGTTATTASRCSETTSSASQCDEDVRDLHVPEVLESLINNIEFQEKLAQNINKAMPHENVDKDTQAYPIKESDTPSNLSSQSSASIDELLNLHMSDDTIHDIVQKTSSDPAFESLFSLFSQNSQDGSNLQFDNLTNDTPACNDDIMTDQSPVPSTSQSRHSHGLPDQDVGQVVPRTATQSAGEVAPVSESATRASSVLETESRNTGQLNATSSHPAVTSSFTEASHQVVTSSTTHTTLIPPTDQVVTLPVILNQAGSYQVLQQTDAANPQKIILNSQANVPGGTIFMATDGRILGTSGLVLQSGQSLSPSGVVESVSIRQASTQGVVSNGEVHSATMNNSHACPIHGTKGGYSGVSVPDMQQESGTSARMAVTSVTSTVNTNNVQISSGEGQSEVVQLLGSMVQSDVGSLFSSSPGTSHSRSPISCKQSPQKARSRKRGARSRTPSSQTLNRNNLNNNSETVENHRQNQDAQSTDISVRPCPSQAISETQSTLSAVNRETAVLNPGLLTGRLASSVLNTSSEAGAPRVSPPVKTVKQRKHIQFKEIVLPRTLDVGGSPESPPKQKRRSPASARHPRASKTKRQGSNMERSEQSKASNPATPTMASSVASGYETVPTCNSTPDKVLPVVSDMSAEVNIAAQMLVCLSNSPPSLRQSPNRLHRLRRNSPARNPTSEHIVELRKEIGLSSKNSCLQQDNQSNLGLHVPHNESARVINAMGNDKGKSLDRLAQEQTQKDVTSSKRKSRTPHKQTNTLTETVVLTIPSSSNQKSKTSTPLSDQSFVPSSIQTRAASLKSKSPRKFPDDPVATRKSSRNSKSPGKPVVGMNRPGDCDLGNDVSQHSAEESGQKERGQKRSREGNNREQITKKPKTAKNSKKGKKSQGFPSNLDVDKFLSSLQYAE